MTLKTDDKIGKLHFCQFDHDGLPVAANYKVACDESTDRSANIYAAYAAAAHETMPDGMYKRMEARLVEKNGAAGFYYCVADDGVPFWVSVSLYPTSRGVLACHFRIADPRMSHLGTFFAQLHAMEQAGLSPEESGKQLLELSKKDNAKDYRNLAIEIMGDHLRVRLNGGMRPQFERFQQLAVMLRTLIDIETLGVQIGTISERSRLIPFQLKLQAAKLEGGRGPISVIAGNHQALTDNLLEITQNIQRASAAEIGNVADALAYLAQSNLAAELIENHMAAGTGPDRLPPEVAEALREVIADCAGRVDQVLVDINKSSAKVTEISQTMHRALSAMEMTRLMCKVERAKIEGPAEGLGNIVDQLRLVEQNLSNVVLEIDKAVKDVRGLVEQAHHWDAAQVA